MLTPKEEIIRACLGDPCKAHDIFFHHKHAQPPAPFHRLLERDFHSSHPRILWLVFRGGAKSTKLEEGTVLEIALQRVHNVLVIGESEQRACERLAAIKHAIEFDEDIQNIFDLSPGDPWSETRAVTNTGIILQAAGRGQSLRGVKHLDRRPDLVLMDDIEDEESGAVATPEARQKVRNWLTKTVIPAMDNLTGRIRMAATPLHPEALAPTLARAPSWFFRKIPVIYRDASQPHGYAASWPEKFSVEWALRHWSEMAEIGQSQAFVQEMLCQEVDPSTRVFSEDMIRVVPRERSWHPVYAVYDPARTTNKASATTGKVVASWVGRKLIVWDAFAKKLMPDEIVSDIFETDKTYSPVVIGVEQNGLNEWLLQPIRTEQVRRGCLVPLRALDAPKGKLDFIRGLQPYFRAGEVEFAQELPDLRSQLLGFPTGLIDAPNALAYMLKLKLGVPIYDGFRDDFVSPHPLDPRPKPLLLAINTDNRVVSAALLQQHAGALYILADWLEEGDAGGCLTHIVDEANLRAVSSPDTGKGGPDAMPSVTRTPLRPSSPSPLGHRPRPTIRLVAPPHHFNEMSPYGLKPVARSLGLRLYAGADPQIGREEIRRAIRAPVASLYIDPDARWTLRALAGGYARDVDKHEPQDTAYSVLMLGLESCVGLRGRTSELDSPPNFAYTPGGQRYISALVK
jgi:hypothetical protein